MYSTLTETQRSEIIRQWESYRGITDARHATACVACNYLCKGNTRTWNSQRGTDAYAAVIAVLVHRHAAAFNFPS